MCPNNTSSNLFLDASPTWSGFNYQGKVALYTALTYINNSAVDTSNYKLELEWLEDFAIKCDADYISVHQVKAYCDESLSKYSEAVFKLFEKIACGQAPKAYLHTWKDINLHGESWRTKIKNIILQTIDSGDNILSELTRIHADDNQVEEYISKIKKPGRCRSTIYKIIKENVQGYFERNTDKTSGDLSVPLMKMIICEIINNYPSNLESYKTMINTDVSILEKIERFSYSGNNFCEIDQIHNLIEEQITQYYTITGHTEKAIDLTHKNRAYLHLLGEIDSYITNRHLEYQNRVKACLNFSRLIEILESPMSENSEVYYLYHLRNEINRIREIYCKDCTESVVNSGNSIEDACQICNLASIMNEINSLNYEYFKRLCKNLSPEVVGDRLDIQNFRQYLPEKGLRSSVFEALYFLQKEYCMDENKIEYKLNNNVIALLTTIFFQGPERQREGDKRRIADALIKNIEMEESLREIDLMISVDVDIPSISEVSSKFNNITRECLEELEEEMHDEENIIKPKKVSIKPVNHVKEERM
jgi:tetratricopeptide (TPR) repeat protein